MGPFSYDQSNERSGSNNGARSDDVRPEPVSFLPLVQDVLKEAYAHYDEANADVIRL